MTSIQERCVYDPPPHSQTSGGRRRHYFFAAGSKKIKNFVLFTRGVFALGAKTMDETTVKSILFDLENGSDPEHTQCLMPIDMVELWHAFEALFDVTPPEQFIQHLLRVSDLIAKGLDRLSARILTKLAHHTYIKMALSIPVPGDPACLALAFQNAPIPIRRGLYTLLLCSRRLGFKIPVTIVNDHIFPALMAYRAAVFDARAAAMFRQLRRCQNLTAVTLRMECASRVGFIPIGGEFVNYVVCDYHDIPAALPRLKYLIQLARDYARGTKSLEQVQNLPLANRLPVCSLTGGMQQVRTFTSVLRMISPDLDGAMSSRNGSSTIARHSIVFHRKLNGKDYKAAVAELVRPIARAIIGYPAIRVARTVPAARWVYRNTDQDVRDVAVTVMLCAKRNFGIGASLPYLLVVELIFGYIVPNVVEVRRALIGERARQLIFVLKGCTSKKNSASFYHAAFGRVKLSNTRSPADVVRQLTDAVFEHCT